jgi:hypothetical protein
MPCAIPGHRSSPSIDKLLDQLDETEVHLLLADLNNSPDVHIPVAEAIGFYEKPRRHRYGHGLAAKRAVSSPCLASARRSQLRDITPPPPMPAIPLAITIPSAKELSPSPTLAVSESCIHTDTITTNSKRVFSLPLLDGVQDFQPAERNAEPTACVNTSPQTTTLRMHRAYKRISRPPLLAEYLSSSDIAWPANRHSPSLNSSRSMLDLRTLSQWQKDEDDHRPADILEPMVLDAWSPGVNIPLVPGNSRLMDAPSMDSLFGALTAGNQNPRYKVVRAEPAESSNAPAMFSTRLYTKDHCQARVRV